MYTPSQIYEHIGNPLIEALPPLVDDATILKRIKLKQRCTEEEGRLPAFYRQKFLSRLNQFVEPTVNYLEIYRSIENAILEGYTAKNPLSPTTQSFLHYLDYNKLATQPNSGRFVPRGSVITILGPSGMGKSYMVTRILEQFPQIIKHELYNGKALNLDQIVWIKIDCPENLTVAGLLAAIILEIDRQTGTKDVDRIIRSRNAIGVASVNIERRLRWHSVGLLAIDEIQNLDLNNKSQIKLFLQFLLVLFNRSGVPLLLIGNTEVRAILEASLKDARRTESGGVFILDPLPEDEWELFVEHLWSYQWTSPRTPLSSDLSSHLRKLSKSMPSFAISIFKQAQKMVMDSGNETITKAVLTEAYEVACRLSKGLLNEEPKPKGSVISISKHINGSDIDSLETDKIPTDMSSQEASQIRISDINRIQHEEFRGAINQGLNSIDNLIVDSIDFLADFKEDGDPLENYRSAGLLFDGFEAKK